jgi:hypothetical protein
MISGIAAIMGLATFVYTLVIVKDFISDSRVQKSLLEILVVERFELEQKVGEQNQESAEITEQIKKGKETVKELQDVISNQKIEIRKFEETMAKKGKYKVE